jgi:alpha-mannosidase
LNNPLIPVVAQSHPGRLPREYSFLSVEPSNVIVTALKKAESGDGLILRFYECEGLPGDATIRFGAKAGSVRETDLLERPIGREVPLTGGKVRIPFGKWEIKTYCISE